MFRALSFLLTTLLSQPRTHLDCSEIRAWIFFAPPLRFYVMTHVWSLFDIDFPNMNPASVHLRAQPIAHGCVTDHRRTSVLSRPQTENKAEAAGARTHRVHPRTTTNETDHSCKLHSAQPSEINALTSKEIEYEK